MNHLSFDLIASLQVAREGWGQLGLLFWAIPLMVFGSFFRVANESDNTWGMIALSTTMSRSFMFGLPRVLECVSVRSGHWWESRSLAFKSLSCLTARSYA